MMKFYFKAIFLVCACVFYSCADLSQLESDVEDVRQEIEELTAECEEINSRIESLQQLVQQIQSRETITGVTEIKDVYGQVIGYTITFKNAETITFYLSVITDAPSTAPVISVVEEEDGVWWVINGEYILDSKGNKVPVGLGRDCPQLKVEGRSWFMSLDGGKTWAEVPALSDAGGAGVESVVDGEGEVTFVLTDGTVLTVPKFKTATLDIPDYNRNIVLLVIFELNSFACHTHTCSNS